VSEGSGTTPERASPGGAVAVPNVPDRGRREVVRASAYCSVGTSRGVGAQEMAEPADVVSVLVALEFVGMTLVVVLSVPFEVAAPLVPLGALVLLALLLFLSSRF